MVDHTKYIGDSGAVYATMAWGLIHNPKKIVFMFPFATPLPEWVAGTFTIGIDVLQLQEEKTTKIGHSAHVGGAMYGTFFYLVFKLFHLRR